MSGFDKIQQREQGLQRKLTARQMGMIAIGGAIGTGLFLGSKFAISFAGPSVIVSYAIGGLITLLLMGCLAEMTVAHATSGSFGAFAEHYVGPLAGFLVRYCYWACIVLAVGTEVTAVAEYMLFWFPHVHSWIWMVLFSAIIIGANVVSVKTFGSIEYWFATIKIFAIAAFIIMSIYVLFSYGDGVKSVNNLVDHNGFFPNGFWGMWVAVIISIFSYLSIEMIAIAAGEAEEPEKAVKQAFRATIIRLLTFYLISLTLILMIVPWTMLVTENATSPFVTVMHILKIPYASSILNFVVIVAALSAMNSMLYITTRMMFSLSRAGDAPLTLGKIAANGVPINALLLSASGIALAVFIHLLYPEQSFTMMIALSMFGAIFTWGMIFFTHLLFRKKWVNSGNAPLSFRLPFYPFSTLIGLFLMCAIMITTAFTPVFRMTLVFGIPFLTLLVFLFYFVRNKAHKKMQN